MPRFVIERNFPDGLSIPVNDMGAGVALKVVGRNGEEGVTWIHSYVTSDKKKTFCIYDGPTPQSIRKVAERNGMPVDRISEMRVLNPYSHL